MTESSSSSRNSTPTPQSRRNIVFDIKNRDFQFVCAQLFLSFINTILPSSIFLSSLRHHDSIHSIHNEIMYICCILYSILSSTLFDHSYSNFADQLSHFWLSPCFNYLAYVLGCYYSSIVLFPFYISLFARSLKGVFMALGRLYSGKNGELAKLILSFSKPGCNNSLLTRSAALFEILTVPYLLFALIILLNQYVLIGFVISVYYIIRSKDDQDHKQIWCLVYSYINYFSRTFNCPVLVDAADEIARYARQI